MTDQINNRMTDEIMVKIAESIVENRAIVEALQKPTPAPIDPSWKAEIVDIGVSPVDGRLVVELVGHDGTRAACSISFDSIAGIINRLTALTLLKTDPENQIPCVVGFKPVTTPHEFGGDMLLGLLLLADGRGQPIFLTPKAADQIAIQLEEMADQAAAMRRGEDIEPIETVH